MFYVIAYVLMSLGSFGMILLMSRAGFEADQLDDFKGLNKRSPWFAGIMLMFMFSMAGIPFFVGFFAKFSVLQAVVAAGYMWLALVAVLFSLIGAFYYLRVVKLMYFDARWVYSRNLLCLFALTPCCALSDSNYCLCKTPRMSGRFLWGLK
jgi:NADH-quinone oxidoreductase subunit N